MAVRLRTPLNRRGNGTGSGPDRRTGGRRWRVQPVWADALGAALPSWAVARVAVTAAWLVAIVAMDKLRPGERTLQLDQGLLPWDGSFYRDIAADGYGAQSLEALRFFPLVPLLARFLAVPLLGNVDLALLVVANVGALAAGLLLYRLVVHERGDARLAARATWLLAIGPPAFVLVFGYAESVALTAAIGAFLGLRRERWWTAAAAGFVAGLTRPVGIFLAVPAAIEVARNVRRDGWGSLPGRLGAVLGPVAGTATYQAWVAVEHGDRLLPFRVQQRHDLRGSFTDPISRAIESGQNLFGDAPMRDGLHFPFIIGALVLLAIVLRTWPVSYGIYSALILTTALSGESLGSFERYAMSAFPLLLAVAGLTASPRLERTVMTACGAGLVAFTTLAWLGTYVP